MSRSSSSRPPALLLSPRRRLRPSLRHLRHLRRPVTWTGIFLGGQIGYAWGDNAGAFATPGGLFGGDDLGDNAQGVIGGGHLGYNLQIDQFVIGTEGTVDGTTLSRNVLVAFTNPTGTLGGSVTGTVRSNVQGSISGRAGIAIDRLPADLPSARSARDEPNLLGGLEWFW